MEVGRQRDMIMCQLKRGKVDDYTFDGLTGDGLMFLMLSNVAGNSMNSV